jgi:hypothetical protein
MTRALQRCSARFLIGPSAGTLLLACIAGCGANQGHVSGQVFYKGKPLPGGQLTFISTDPTKRPVSTDLDENGRYQANLPLGEVAIAVENQVLKPPERPPGSISPLGVKLPPAEKEAGEAKPNPSALKKPPGTYVPIPEKYFDAKTSGLTYTVTSGTQTHNIELTDEPLKSRPKRPRGP